MESEAVEAIAALAHHDIRLTLQGGVARVEVDGEAVERRWVTETGYRPTDRIPTLVIGSRIPPRLVASIRRNGDWYVDALGNAFISSPGIRVDIRGQRPPETPMRSARAKNLFSPRRAQVVFCLLTWPELLTAPVRTVARAAGVSPAIANQTSQALREEGYGYPGGARLERYDELLERWAEAFPLGLGRDLTLGQFAGDTDPRAWVDSGIPVYLSGESAVPSIRGTTLTMYVPKISVPAVISSRWRPLRADEEPAIIVRRTFWEAPDQTYGAERGAKTAPDLLIYADLLSSRDPRQREVALTMRESLREHGAR
ncbi:type IV toxin-antitoxin system AbiEi family antitoxin [Sanguibacter inulinus]|uniref:Uncharacterized protein n=1 Tax=Sanguibacter inulinus TaxID=60922 RepID=A0A853EU32_9MICO|nr:type IV toxin-antitoxin system AbiEi family antitoxin [Sanguibacter inulinus]MBF0723061.1 hypothetical protein [Sanguibacter inulinus]NYS94206.1 hypothetical protein [Sanguibacter inulinus]